LHDLPRRTAPPPGRGALQGRADGRRSSLEGDLQQRWTGVIVRTAADAKGKDGIKSQNPKTLNAFEKTNPKILNLKFP